MADGEPVLGSLYVYAPNQVAPIFFAVAFGCSAVGHIWQCYRYKAFRLIGLHPLCAILFTAGYALREYGAFNYLFSIQNLLIFIFSQVFIFVCPPLLELANYHVLGRIFYYVPFLTPLPPGAVLRTFGGVMAVVEALNAIGVALAANPSSQPSQQALGKNLTVAAVAIQVAVIASFFALAGLFHFRIIKTGIRARAVAVPLRTLYASMALIFVRSVYRLVEHTGHTEVRLRDMDALRRLTPLLRYEWFFYVFEASLMLINSAIWNVWHPGRYLPRSHQVHLAEDGTEVRGEDKPDERPLLKKAGNVLTFGMLWRRRDGREFQELGEYPGSRA
ncbi:RTA1 domain-containing protein [Madurella fahalii]|uniref:RTA1 domain-containing protein n=1 Tax=Madurella fahalii TaxID=1157608 RepID=A0ABQ0GMD5_9PEZI